MFAEASLTEMTTRFVPCESGMPDSGDCKMVSAPDKSVAIMKFVPVTFGINAVQFVSSDSSRFVKLHVITGSVVSRTTIVRETVFVLLLASTAR